MFFISGLSQATHQALPDCSFASGFPLATMLFLHPQKSTPAAVTAERRLSSRAPAFAGPCRCHCRKAAVT